MINIKKTIYKYWQFTPELFSEKYENSPKDYFSPVSLFLLTRRKRVMKLSGKIKNKIVLDVACGSGIFMIDYIKRGAKVVGLDYSKKMLDIAEATMKMQKIPKNKYKLIQANATKIPLKDRSFDLLIATGLTDYMNDDDDQKFLKEASRLIKKDGKLIISFPKDSSPFAPLRSGVGLIMRRKISKLPPIQNTFSKEKIIKFLKNANLRYVKSETVFYTMWLVTAAKK